jgi:hypothetical protein
MSKVSLRRLLSRLTALALFTGAVGPVSAAGQDVQDVDDAELAGDLPIDAEQIDDLDAAAALGRGLALALSEMRPLSATQIASTWALSEHPVRRLAVAHALEWTFKLVGDDLIIDHLSRDPDAAIRLEVARAAWVRRTSGVDPSVLARLSDDPDPAVRATARRANPTL